MINKLVISKGAVFDYEEIVCGIPLDISEMRVIVEKQLDKAQYSESEIRWSYLDKRSDKELMLFLKKGHKFGLMQVWFLGGICEKSDYSEDMEELGIIKEWLEVEIE